MAVDCLSEFNFSPRQVENGMVLFERIKREKECDEDEGDHRGVMAVDRLQMLCDVAARSAATTIPTQLTTAVIKMEPLNVTVNNVCHFFSEIDLTGPDVPTTPKITTIQFVSYSDQSKAKAQQAWIRRMRMTPIRLNF